MERLKIVFFFLTKNYLNDNFEHNPASGLKLGGQEDFIIKEKFFLYKSGIFLIKIYVF